MHPGFVGFHVRRKGGNVLVPVFCPQVGFLVEDEEVAQLLQAHGVDVFEQNRVLPLEMIGSRHDKLLMNVRVIYPIVANNEILTCPLWKHGSLGNVLFQLIWIQIHFYISAIRAGACLLDRRHFSKHPGLFFGHIASSGSAKA